MLVGSGTGVGTGVLVGSGEGVGGGKVGIAVLVVTKDGDDSEPDELHRPLPATTGLLRV